MFGVIALQTVYAQKKAKPDVRKMDKKEKVSKDIKERRIFFDATRLKLIGNTKGAISAFQEVIEINDENHTVWFELARLYQEEGNFSEASKAIEKAISLDKNNPYYYSVSAILHQNFGEISKAIKAYQKVLEYYPTKIDLYMSIAQLQERMGSTKKAQQTYQEAQEKTGALFEITQHKINSYLKNKEYQKAIKEITQLITESPDYYEFKEYLGDVYVMAQDVENALKVYDELLNENPTLNSVRIKKARIEVFLAKETEAFKTIQPAIVDPETSIDLKMEFFVLLYEATRNKTEMPTSIYDLLSSLTAAHPKDAKSYSMAGDFYFRAKKDSLALNVFLKASELAPDKILIWEQVVSIQTSLGKWNELVISTEKCKVLFPNNPVFYLYSGIALGNAAKKKEAVESLEAGVSLVIENKNLEQEFYLRLASLNDDLGNLSETERYFEKALKLNPNNALTLNNYAYSLSINGKDLEKALGMAKKANELMPLQPSFLDTKGWVFFKMGKYKEAEETLKLALNSGGNKSGEVLEHFGDVLFKLGKKTEALEYWKKAKTLGGGSELLEKKIETQNWVDASK